MQRGPTAGALTMHAHRAGASRIRCEQAQFRSAPPRTNSGTSADLQHAGRKDDAARPWPPYLGIAGDELEPAPMRPPVGGRCRDDEDARRANPYAVDQEAHHLLPILHGLDELLGGMA